MPQNPYRRPASPQARRAEMMRATAMRKRGSRIFQMDFVNGLERRIADARSAAETFDEANKDVLEAVEDLMSLSYSQMTSGDISTYSRLLDARDQAFNRWKSLNDPIAGELRSIGEGALSVGVEKGSNTEEYKAYGEAVVEMYGSPREFFNEIVGAVHSMETAEDSYKFYMGVSYQSQANEERRGLKELEKNFSKATGDEDEDDYLGQPADVLVEPPYFDVWDITAGGDARDFAVWRDSLNDFDSMMRDIANQWAGEREQWVEDLRY